jgi:hypothetical protein
MTKAKKKTKTRVRLKQSEVELIAQYRKLKYEWLDLGDKMAAIDFELGQREDARCCESDNPDRWCSHCTCWKITRQRCS